MIRSFALTLLLVASTAAHAQRYPRPEVQRTLRKAAEALDDAARKARRATPACHQTLEEPLEQAANRLEALRDDPRPGLVVRLRADLSSLSESATWGGCPDGVIAKLHRAQDQLDDLRLPLAGPGTADGDDDEQRPWRQVFLAPLQVRQNSRFEGEPAVMVIVPELTLRRMEGKTFYFGARFRSFQGNWSDWVTTQQWQINSDQLVWKNAFKHAFRFSSLAEEDFDHGRFVARVSVFDGEGRELAFRETNFTVNLPQLPSPMPMPVQPPPGPPMARDCGTGPDLGCQLRRDGQMAIDGATFQGFMQAVQATRGDLMRIQTVQTMFANRYATAVQFGLILDLFQSDMMKMEVAQMMAPHIVNPQHALGYTDKFASNMLRTGYAQLMAQQPPGD